MMQYLERLVLFKSHYIYLKSICQLIVLVQYVGDTLLTLHGMGELAEDAAEGIICRPPPLDVVQLRRLRAQLGAEVGVGDGDQLLHPLPHGLAPERGDAILRHHVVDEGARHSHHRPGRQHGDDARLALAVDRRAGGRC